MEINTKIQPLIEDLNRVLPCEFLTSTEYKRWLVAKDLDAVWKKFVRYVSDNRNYYMVGFDHAAHDAKEALGYMLNMIFEQNKEELPVFIVDLLSYFSVEKSKCIEISDIRKDLIVAGYTVDEMAILDNIPTPVNPETTMEQRQEQNVSQNVDNHKNTKTMNNTNKTPMVFISHSHKDEKFVVALVNLLEDMGFTQETLFCSSVREYGVPLSGGIFETIRGLFQEHDLYVIFVHSPRFYGSAVSLNEMGAAWVLKSDFCSILTNDMDYSMMKGVVNNASLSIKVNDKEARLLLNDMYNHLRKLFALPQMDVSKWERKRDQFLEVVTNLKYEEVINCVEENGVDVEYKKLQIEKMKFEAASRQKAIIRGNIVKEYRPGGRTLKIFNAGMALARNVRVEWLNKGEGVLIYSDFSNIGELTPQNSRSYNMALLTSHPETMKLRYTWDDDFSKENQIEESLQL